MWTWLAFLDVGTSYENSHCNFQTSESQQVFLCSEQPNGQLLAMYGVVYPDNPTGVALTQAGCFRSCCLVLILHLPFLLDVCQLVWVCINFNLEGQHPRALVGCNASTGAAHLWTLRGQVAVPPPFTGAPKWPQSTLRQHFVVGWRGRSQAGLECGLFGCLATVSGHGTQVATGRSEIVPAADEGVQQLQGQV